MFFCGIKSSSYQDKLENAVSSNKNLLEKQYINLISKQHENAGLTTKHMNQHEQRICF